MGDDLWFVESTEPTNIIWENRFFTPRDYLRRGIIVFGVIFLLLAASFIAIFICKTLALQGAAKYPNVDCNDIKTVYGKENMAKYSYNEWQRYYNFPEGEERSPQQGVIKCFCKDQAAISGSDLSNFVVNDPYGKNPPVKVCAEFVTDGVNLLFYNSAIQYMIVGINYVLRLFIIKLIIYLGKDTESEQTKLITNGVFIVQFFNTALLLLMVNANLTEQSDFLGSFFARKITDFNTIWFADIGNTLIGAMIFNLYWPIMEFCAFYGLRTTFRLLDKSFNIKSDSTKKTTIQQYIELYSGPTFFIHYKYSTILNIVFVTMMYGIGLPILFPIASGSLFVLFVVEKIMIHYSYRAPPMYDEKLNNNVLTVLTYAPLLFLSFGYWMLSNKQLISNDHLYKFNNLSDVRKSGHIWTSVFTAEAYDKNPGMPLLIAFWIVLFGTIFRHIAFKYGAKIFPSIKIGDIEIDEDLDNYFNTLDDHDRNWSIKEEENSR